MLLHVITRLFNQGATVLLLNILQSRSRFLERGVYNLYSLWVKLASAVLGALFVGVVLLKCLYAN